jgi:hypothetical protein
MSMPPYPPRPVPRPRPPRRPAAPVVPARRWRWGWLESFVLIQTLLMAMLFVPGVSPVRPYLRIASYGAGLVFWCLVLSRGRTDPVGLRYSARWWLGFSGVWLLLELFHPNSYSLVAALAQAALYISVFAPAFWAPRVLNDTQQLGRLMAVIFACNALSVLLGIGQVFHPETFNPPAIPALENKFHGEDLMYETADGRRILRPCGLTDTPGGAATAGTTVALLGLCWALQPVAFWKRLGGLGMGFLGVSVIYYTNVRVTMVMLVISMITLAVLLVLQGNYRKAALLTAGGAGLLVGAMAWAVRTAGTRVFDRFFTVVEHGPFDSFLTARGGLVGEGLNALVTNPIGYGLGWWGQINGLFSIPGKISPVWVEVMVQAFAYDGGLPLMIGYVGAITVALYDSTRIALTTRDRALAFWAVVITALNLSIAASCFSFVTFLSPVGLNFWILSAALNAADAQSRLAGHQPAPGASRTRPRPMPRPAGPHPSGAY